MKPKKRISVKSKTIKVNLNLEQDVWKDFVRIKYDNNLKNYNETLRYLMEQPE